MVAGSLGGSRSDKKTDLWSLVLLDQMLLKVSFCMIAVNVSRAFASLKYYRTCLYKK